MDLQLHIGQDIAEFLQFFKIILCDITYGMTTNVFNLLRSVYFYFYSIHQYEYKEKRLEYSLCIVELQQYLGIKIEFTKSYTGKGFRN